MNGLSYYTFLLRCIIYIICFVFSAIGCSAIHYEKLLKKNVVIQATVLYWMIVLSMTYLTGSLIISFIYRLTA